MKEGRTRDMSRSDVLKRAASARQFLEAARDIHALHPGSTDVVANNAVHAGIAAADAICGHVLRRSSAGEGHHQAVALLAGAVSKTDPAVSDLRRLVELKTGAAYSPEITSGTNAEKAVTWAARLVAAMEDVLARPA
jgi:hypothetical protein